MGLICTPWTTHANNAHALFICATRLIHSDLHVPCLPPPLSKTHSYTHTHIILPRTPFFAATLKTKSVYVSERRGGWGVCDNAQHPQQRVFKNIFIFKALLILRGALFVLCRALLVLCRAPFIWCRIFNYLLLWRALLILRRVIPDMNHSCVWHDLVIRDMTHSHETWLNHLRHDSFTGDMPHSYVWHDSVVRDMTHSQETWLSHIRLFILRRALFVLCRGLLPYGAGTLIILW